jgi:uncharacterized protein (DUF58 family)
VTDPTPGTGAAPGVGRALGVGIGGLALLLLALGLDAPSLSVAGAGLAVLGLGAAGWVAAASTGASLERTLPAARVQEEEPFPVRLTFEPGFVVPPGARIDDPLLGLASAPLRRGQRRVRLDVRFARRGRRRLGPSRVLIGDPLGLASRAVHGPPGEVLVLPRIEPVLLTAGESGASGAVGGVAGLEIAAAEVELDGLRPYRAGAPASRIHWPTVARTGEMVERRFVAEAADRPLVALDARLPESEEALDAAVRAAASLARHLAERGGCGVLLPGERRPVELARDLLGWPSLHARLAAVTEVERSPVLERAGSTGPVFWVTARGGSALPAALARVPGRGRVLVAPTAMPGRPVLFTVAGCVGQRLEGVSARRAAA